MVDDTSLTKLIGILVRCHDMAMQLPEQKRVTFLSLLDNILSAAIQLRDNEASILTGENDDHTNSESLRPKTFSGAPSMKPQKGAGHLRLVKD